MGVMLVCSLMGMLAVAKTTFSRMEANAVPAVFIAWSCRNHVAVARIVCDEKQSRLAKL